MYETLGLNNNQFWIGLENRLSATCNESGANYILFLSSFVI